MMATLALESWQREERTEITRNEWVLAKTRFLPHLFTRNLNGQKVPPDMKSCTIWQKRSSRLHRSSALFGSVLVGYFG
jgi:hypothetical protein